MNDGLSLEMLERDTRRVGQPVLVIAQHDAMADLLKDPRWVARAYAGGVPMGGDLPQRARVVAPGGADAGFPGQTQDGDGQVTC